MALGKNIKKKTAKKASENKDNTTPVTPPTPSNIGEAVVPTTIKPLPSIEGIV